MLLMALTLSISFDSCSSATVGAAISQLNSQCPQDLGTGLTMTKSELGDGNWVITVSAPNGSAELFDGNAMKPNLLSYVKSDADMVSLLKESNTALIYKFVFPDGEDQVSVSPSEL